MLSREAGVRQDDVGPLRAADPDVARAKLECHAAMKAGRALENESRWRRRDDGGEPSREGRHQPGSGHFEPHIRMLNVPKVDSSAPEESEGRHKGLWPPESGVDIGAV